VVRLSWRHAEGVSSAGACTGQIAGPPPRFHGLNGGPDVRLPALPTVEQTAEKNHYPASCVALAGAWSAPTMAQRSESEGSMANESAASLVRGSPPAAGEGLTADAFRGLEKNFHNARSQNSADAEAAAVLQRRELVKALIDQHIDDAKWREFLHQAQRSAERGDKEHLLLSFPSELCTDDARAINNPPNPDWPKTLQGEAEEVYARWRDELSPRGFHLAARVLDFPDGKPGDVGLFLLWGE
jgi:uncharacterized membrane protein